MSEPDAIVDEIAHAVIGAAIEVHRTLGPGYLESVYVKALCLELDHVGLSYEFEKPIAVLYRGENVGEGRFDLLVEQRLIVEVKAVEKRLPIHRAQVISYLKATGLTLGLLINFKEPTLRTGILRVIVSNG